MKQFQFNPRAILVALCPIIMTSCSIKEGTRIQPTGNERHSKPTEKLSPLPELTLTDQIFRSMEELMRAHRSAQLLQWQPRSGFKNGCIVYTPQHGDKTYLKANYGKDCVRIDDFGAHKLRTETQGVESYSSYKGQTRATGSFTLRAIQLSPTENLALDMTILRVTSIFFGHGAPIAGTDFPLTVSVNAQDRILSRQHTSEKWSMRIDGKIGFGSDHSVLIREGTNIQFSYRPASTDSNSQPYTQTLTLSPETEIHFSKTECARPLAQWSWRHQTQKSSTSGIFESNANGLLHHSSGDEIGWPGHCLEL